ncbi:hypothetical protein FQZ97_1139060 [compost metagenome]
MFIPHGRENTELGIGRLAADQRNDLVELVGFEAVIGNQLGGDGDVVLIGHQEAFP